MSDGSASRLSKWPFYAADAVLSGAAVIVLYRVGRVSSTGEVLICVAALAAAAWGAWLSILPWLTEYRGATARTETSALASTLEQIKKLQQVGQLIENANSRWQSAQDSAARTVSAAGEIAAKMKSETEEFMKFLQNANEQEKAHLRLEVEKGRRAETEWLQVAIRMLDHVFALYQAAVRAGQGPLVQQLDQFQQACRDAGRRVGLIPFVPELLEAFDPRLHQLNDPQAAAGEGAKVGLVLAAGYTYQGQLLRRSLVVLAKEAPKVEPPPSLESEPVEESPQAQLPLV